MRIDGLDNLNRRLNAIGDTRRLLEIVQIAAIREAKQLTIPFSKTRNLSRGIQPGSLSDTSAVVRSIAAYSRYVEEGTGLYGPRHQKIVPRTKPFLAWQVGAGGAGGSQLRLSGRSRVRGGRAIGEWAFAKSVKGRPATPFLKPGVEKVIASRNLAGIVVAEWNKAG